jgi:hypothetical protein
MTPNISNREWEALSAYLDGQLNSRESSRLEIRIKDNLDLQVALEELRITRDLLRSQPELSAPRNFTLNQEMVGLITKKRSPFKAFPVLSFVSALATVFFVIVLVGDLLFGVSTISPSYSVLPPEQEMPALEKALPQFSPDISGDEEISELSPTGASLSIMEEPVEEGIELEAAVDFLGETQPGRAEKGAVIGPTESIPDVSSPSPTATHTLERELTLTEGVERLLETVTPEMYPSPNGIDRGPMKINRVYLRVLEGFLAIIALIAALTAFYFYRFRN